MDRVGWVLCIALAGVGVGVYGIVTAQRLSARIDELKQAAPTLPTSPAAAEIPASLYESSRKVHFHEMQINELYEMIRPLEDSSRAARLDARSKGFDLAMTPYGAFPVSIEDAKPHKDGIELIFKLGNALSATVSSVSMEISYGRELAKDLVESDPGEWSRRYNRTRKGSVKVSGDLASGRWTRVRVVLPEATPSDVERVDITLRIGGLVLDRAPVAKPVVGYATDERLSPRAEKAINKSLEEAAEAATFAAKAGDLADRITKEQALKPSPTISPELQEEYKQLVGEMQAPAR
jgi:hypothetical protein